MPDIKAPPGIPASAWRAYGQSQQHHHPHGGGHRQGTPYDRAAPAGEGVVDPVDAVRILGLNPRAYPEEVEAVLADLMGRIDQLRHELENAVARQGWLENQADQDGALPVLNRRAFLRELDGFAAARPPDEEPGRSGALALFYLHNFEILHRRLGLEAAEGALAHMASVLRAGVRSSDVLGFAGGAGVAVLLGLAGEEGAQAKVDALRALLATSPAHHGDAAVPLRVVAAIAPAEPGEGAHAWMERADSRLRSALLVADAGSERA
ncbi:GGDEF domain-containing protein [Novispirillum sp. DQ9]|uniref:GGDEF domain-containing protein n=1 Tax=Novispirillum sp. DQ9 TaxID=3398612 RepID=UPI003C7D7853